MATNIELIKKIKDMVDLAEASYAELHYVIENIDSVFESREWKEADDIMFGDKIDNNIKDPNDENVILHKKGDNTAYARCIEARFMQDVAIKKGVFKNTTINNDPKNVLLDSTLSHRTKNFVNRYELVHHIPNTLSGFSTTIFRDLGEFNIAADTRNFENDFLYIIAFRGTRAAVLIRGGGVFEWRAICAPSPHRPSEPLPPFQSRLWHSA